MANLDITEYANIGNVGLNIVPVADARNGKIASQSIAIGSSSAASAAFNANTHLIRVHAEALCAVEIGGSLVNGLTPGATPVAVAPNGRMAVGQTEYFVVSPGDKLAVITST